jgi:uncharacterized protein
MTLVTRREALAGLTAATAALALRAGAARAAPGPIWLGCRSDPEIGDQIAAFDGSGAVRMALPLPARGHAMALHPGRDEAVVFARRPGSFAVVFAPERGLAIRRFDSPASRHFHGHGVYDPTGRLLIATENDREHPRGVLGIYDAEDGYRRIGEIESHGIEPHQVLLMPDGRTLAAANGGILTGGAGGREKLNLDTMEPVLAYMELGSGKLLEARHMPPELHHLSIRHLAVAADGRLAAGMQWEGDQDAEVPLVGIDDGSGLKLLEMPPELVPAMAHYVGSVAVDPTGRLVAASCPRGNTVTFWDAVEGRFAGAVPMADGCGVAPFTAPESFVLSSGIGRTATVGPDWQPVDLAQADAHFAWDNHLTKRASLAG